MSNKPDHILAVCIPSGGGGPPHRVELPNTIEDFQREVGGYVESRRFLLPDTFILCNEDGRVQKLPPNPHLPGFVGDCLVVAATGGEFRSLTDSEASTILGGLDGSKGGAPC